jgi:hypothetical protein
MGPRPAAVIAARYAQGSCCLGAFNKDQQLVGQLWLQFGCFQEDEVRCRFRLTPPDKVAWDYDVYIDPALRSSFLFARLWDSAFDLLRAKGIEWTASRISAFNTGSLTSHSRLGAYQTGRAIFFTAGTLQVMLASKAPFVDLAIRRSTMPTLELSAPAQ